MTGSRLCGAVVCETAGGTLDVAPGAYDGVHIFVGSKAPWFEITDRRPQYDEYPPG